MNIDQRRAEINRLARLLAEADAEHIALFNRLADITAHRNHIRHRLGAQRLLLALEQQGNT